MPKSSSLPQLALQRPLLSLENSQKHQHFEALLFFFTGNSAICVLLLIHGQVFCSGALHKKLLVGGGGLDKKYGFYKGKY